MSFSSRLQKNPRTHQIRSVRGKRLFSPYVGMIQIRSRVKTSAVYSQPAPADSPSIFSFIIRLFFAVFNPLDKLLSRWHNNGENRGAERLRGSAASTLLPDVGNATVGSITGYRTAGTTRRLLFFSSLLERMCVREAYRRPGHPGADRGGAPCVRARFKQRWEAVFRRERRPASLDRIFRAGSVPPPCGLAVQGENAAVFSLRTYFTKEFLQ